MTDRNAPPGESHFPPDAGGRVIFASDWFRVERLGPFIVRVARSSRAFESRVDAARRCLPVVHELDRVGRSGRSLLFDARRAAPVSDPVYESWYARYRQRMVETFERAAVLIRTQAGYLHLRRLIRQDGHTQRLVVFADEALALRYLGGKMPSVRPEALASSDSALAPRSGELLR